MSDIVIPELILNSNPRIDLWTIGQEGQALVVVDNVLSNPEVLVEYATKASFDAPPPKSMYPGLVAPLPAAYLDLMTGILRGPLVRAFGLHPDFRIPAYGFLGLTTVATEAMPARQAAPHTDAHRLNSFATVHFFSQGDFGGTAFYRHKATGYELVTPAHSGRFTALRRRELEPEDGSPVPALADLYEEIHYVEPVFNRLILYRAGQLHSARLVANAHLPASPNSGRLTANLFFNTQGL